MELAVAVTEATPLLPIVAVSLERAAEAPLDGAANEITPPATGSSGSLAVTLTLKGLAKAVLIVADCGVLPLTRVSVNPWLWKAPMSGAERSVGLKPRWSVVTPLTACPCRWPRCRARAPWSGSARRRIPAGPGRVSRSRSGRCYGPRRRSAPPRRRYRSGCSCPRGCRYCRMSLAPAGLVLPATIVSIRVAVPSLYRPPPSWAAEFPLMVQAVRVRDAMPSFIRPPPRTAAEFPLMVQSVRVRFAVPTLYRPPPFVGRVAADGAVGQGQGRRAIIIQAAAVTLAGFR